MAKTARFEMDMCSGPLLKKLIIYTLPLLLTNVLQLTFNMADIIVLGSLVSDDAVAAVGATGALINLIIGLFVGLSVGANVLVARCVGSGDKDKAHKIVGMSVLLGVTIGILLGIIGFFCSRYFLEWMGCDAEVIDMATKYMRIYFVGMPIILLYNFCAAILRAVGDTVRPLIYLVVGGVVNVGLNVLFVTVFHKDVEGVAIATVVSQLISAVLSVITLLKSEGYARFKWGNLRLYKAELAEMAKIGLPAGLQGCVFSLSNVVIQSTVNSFGKTVMTANTVASQLDGFIYNAMNAVSLSAMAFVSQNLGARNFDRINKTTKEALALAGVVGVVMGGMVLLLRVPLCNLFTDSQEVVQLACGRLYIIATTYFTCGLMDVMSNVMRGLGRSTTAMIVSLSGSCLFRILWIMTLCRWIHTLPMLYWVYPVSWVLTFIIFAFMYKPTLKKVRSAAIAEDEAKLQASAAQNA